MNFSKLRRAVTPDVTPEAYSPDTVTIGEKGLSVLQKWLLDYLYRCTQELEQRSAASLAAFVRPGDQDQLDAELRQAFATREKVWGVLWRTGERPRAEQAAISRAIKRLEDRGLVLRQNQLTGPYRNQQSDPHGRTTHVLLLPAGREAAERLTKKEAKN